VVCVERCGSSKPPLGIVPLEKVEMFELTGLIMFPEIISKNHVSMLVSSLEKAQGAKRFTLIDAGYPNKEAFLLVGLTN
jgi:hypothetical protein